MRMQDIPKREKYKVVESSQLGNGPNQAPYTRLVTKTRLSATELEAFALERLRDTRLPASRRLEKAGFTPSETTPGYWTDQAGSGKIFVRSVALRIATDRLLGREQAPPEQLGRYAKAMGFVRSGPTGDGTFHVCRDATGWAVWNPLTDANDSLEMAEKMKVRFEYWGNLDSGKQSGYVAWIGSLEKVGRKTLPAAICAAVDAALDKVGHLQEEVGQDRNG